jgi:uncharacterized membrane protein
MIHLCALSDHCILENISVIDFINVAYLLALVLLFVFIRREYLRNMEDFIWKTVSQIQVRAFSFCICILFVQN